MVNKKLGDRAIGVIESYILFNKMLLITTLVFFSYLFSVKYIHIALKCENKIRTGIPCKSCGLTRGLVSCLNLEFNQAKQFNIQSIPVFSFACFQLVTRCAFLGVYNLKKEMILSKVKFIFPLDLTVLLFAFLINIYLYGQN